MIKSMTAFAHVVYTHDHITVEVTIRSYNSRSLDISCHVPEICFLFENQIRKNISTFHERGRIDLRVNLTYESDEHNIYEPDMISIRSYLNALESVSDTFKLNQSPTLDQIISVENLIRPVKKKVDQDIIQNVVLTAVKQASLDLDQMRIKEGANLFRDLSNRIDWIERQLDLVKDLAGRIPEIHKHRLIERLDHITEHANMIDPLRLAQEVAILADKSDISEEITRLYSHIKQFKEIINEDGSKPQGTKLNFLIQEFNREFNTVGAKACHAELSHRVVELKSELEKIREQVQNIQ